MKYIYTCWFVMLAGSAFAQSVGIGTTTPKTSAKLDVSSTTQGVTLPTMTSAQRKAISNPAKGLLVFDTDKACFYFYNGKQWRAISNTGTNGVEPVFNDIANTSDGFFATSVAMGNGFAAVGYEGKDTLGITDIGAVYMLKRTSSGQWDFAQIIVPADVSDNNARFGYRVAIDSNYMAISAIGKTEGVLTGAGRVYVYKYNGSSWVFESSFVNPLGSQTNEYYGYALDISHTGTTIEIVVGSPRYANGALTNAGMFSLHKRNPANGIWSAVFTNTGNATSLMFGSSVAISGNNSVVSAIGYDTTISTTTFNNTGVVYSYKYNVSAWAFNNRYVNSIDTGNYFGYKVALSDSVLTIAGLNAGIRSNYSEYLYSRKLDAAGNNFVSIGTVNLSDYYSESLWDNCTGSELAVNNGYVVVGLPMSYTAALFSCTSIYSGIVLIFKQNSNGSLQLIKKLTNNNNASGSADRFGIAVAIDEDFDYGIVTFEITNTNSNKGVMFGNLEE